MDIKIVEKSRKERCLNMLGIIIVALIFFFVSLVITLFGRDKRGFNRKGIHKNRTRFDDFDMILQDMIKMDITETAMISKGIIN